jgi:hypothetical protein
MLRVAVVATLGVVVCGMAAGPAYAHENRRVGPWNLAVGWADEPAFAGQLNDVEVFLHDANDKPVVDLGDTLKVEIIFGTDTTHPSDTFIFKPAFEVGEFGTPGDYRARVVPTRPGTYTFHLTGSIKGTKVDERFTSGEKTFDSPAEIKDVMFPVKDPSTADLSALVDRQFPRIDIRVAAVKKTTDRSTILGYAGIGLGALALIVATASGRRRRKAPA